MSVLTTVTAIARFLETVCARWREIRQRLGIPTNTSDTHDDNTDTKPPTN